MRLSMVLNGSHCRLSKRIGEGDPLDIESAACVSSGKVSLPRMNDMRKTLSLKEDDVVSENAPLSHDARFTRLGRYYKFGILMTQATFLQIWTGEGREKKRFNTRSLVESKEMQGISVVPSNVASVPTSMCSACSSTIASVGTGMTKP
ncbi:hypothetical protein BLNAU_21478 [Blattamonas nauphoetae]|uniref:Uncharacterized protein n=1 Tax=Blattamonas nauphoetae TaxID=2049346 RepID=A0ABQ9WVS4_9EUKA|nr:hypothetical protein BLNAU_21478 [Blattamonas nauphoetae]